MYTIEKYVTHFQKSVIGTDIKLKTMKQFYLLILISIFSSCSFTKKKTTLEYQREKQVLQTEIQELKQENSKLSNQLKSLISENKELKTKIEKTTTQDKKTDGSLNTHSSSTSAVSEVSSLEQLFSSSSKFSTFKNGGMERKLQINKHQMEKIITTAKEYLGTPHVMGGLSKSGIDCSGLLYKSFERNNINNIPRTAQEFGRYGTVIVNINKLKRGDLVFFTNTYTTSKFITHAGIYLGDKKFIHTSSSKGVIISKIDDPYYWKKKFVYGTRVL